MNQWYRVFGTNGRQPEPAALLEHLQGLGIDITGQFRGDDQGWFRVDLSFRQDDAPTLCLESYGATEEGIRDSLNTWAAWLELYAENPNHGRLMQHMVGTTHLFTLERPPDAGHDELLEKACLAVCRFLARTTAGVYQVDHHGFFSPDGVLLIEEAMVNP